MNWRHDTRRRAIAGRYQITGWLGSGGMADVSLAEDITTARRVALKHSRAPRDRALLEREARVLARLGHPNVVRAHDLIVADGASYLVLDYVAGPSLARCPVAPRDHPRFARLFRGLVAALDHLHTRGVVHLDVKAENIMLDLDGEPHLIDLGISACDDEPMPRDGAGTVLGTPRAMAPEQIVGDPVDGRADLFSLGALLYELCTGSAPFAADSPLQATERVLDHTPPPVRSRAPALPRALAELIDHLLEKEPALRPQSAREVAARWPSCR